LWVVAAVGVVPMVLFASWFSLETAPRILATELAVALAAAAAGGAFGFLFGIPRAMANADRRGQLYQSNTNLEQVSDWLTKILIGLGLAQIGALGANVTSLGDTLAKALGESGTTGRVVGLSIVFFYAAMGFILAYLPASISLGERLQDAERRLQTINAALPVAPSKVVEAELRRDAPVSEPSGGRATQLGVEVREVAQSGLAVPAETYRRLALELKREGHYREAVDAYVQAAALDPSDATALNFAGVLCSKYLHDYPRAAELYRRAITVDPSYLSPVYNSACNEARRGATREALRLLAMAIAGDVKYVELARNDRADGGPFIGLRDDPEFLRLLDGG
jgi:tetratricopeptide (TPR) repeat protein